MVDPSAPAAPVPPAAGLDQITKADIQKMKKAELVKALADRNLPTGGKVVELKMALVKWFDDHAPPPPPSRS